MEELGPVLLSSCITGHGHSNGRRFGVLETNLQAAISNAQISLILPGLELLVGSNVRVSGDCARRALSNSVYNARSTIEV